MANKRKLKKEINFITGELFSECLFAKFYLKGTDEEKVDTLLNKIAALQANLLSRVSHPDGKADSKIVKKYYQKLIVDFDNSIDETLGELAELNK